MVSNGHKCTSRRGSKSAHSWGYFYPFVQAGKVPGNNSVGRELMDLVTTVPRMSQEDFESILNSNMQVCLQNLTSRVSNIKIQEQNPTFHFVKS